VRGIRLGSTLLAIALIAACTESSSDNVRVRRVPNPPAYRVSDVVDLDGLGPLLRRAAELEVIPELRVVRHRPGYALVLRDANAEEAASVAARFDRVAIETERRAGSTITRWRTTRAIEGPLPMPTGTLVVSLDPTPPEASPPTAGDLRWAQVSDDVTTWIEPAALAETDRCIPASSRLSELSIVPQSFDRVVLWVALDDGRVAGVAPDPFADETHVTVHAIEEGCMLTPGSLYTKEGRLADLSVDGDEVLLVAPDGTTTRWQPQPGLNLSDRGDDEATAR
jgi:hypothetical protein